MHSHHSAWIVVYTYVIQVLRMEACRVNLELGVKGGQPPFGTYHGLTSFKKAVSFFCILACKLVV